MITIDELKAKLGGMKTAVDDLRDALSIEASEKRLAELYRLCSEAPFCSGVDVVRDPAGADAFFEAVRGLEGEPEGGSRCEKCFRLRLERSARGNCHIVH